jgi:hypothetical protein
LLIKFLNRHYANAWVLKQVFRAAKIVLETKNIQRKTELFFETGGVFPPPSQSNVWEPGVNPGRLRHCNGYKFQSHRQREGGMRFEAKVRIPV